jgi:hypothetical protein
MGSSKEAGGSSSLGNTVILAAYPCPANEIEIRLREMVMIPARHNP